MLSSNVPFMYISIYDTNQGHRDIGISFKFNFTNILIFIRFCDHLITIMADSVWQLRILNTKQEVIPYITKKVK